MLDHLTDTERLQAFAYSDADKLTTLLAQPLTPARWGEASGLLDSLRNRLDALRPDRIDRIDNGG